MAVFPGFKTTNSKERRLRFLDLKIAEKNVAKKENKYKIIFNLRHVIHTAPSDFLLQFSFFSAGDGTWGLMRARQTLHHYPTHSFFYK
jgi:hypothetical protein